MKLNRLAAAACAAFILASCASVPGSAPRDRAPDPSEAGASAPTYVVGVVPRGYLDDPAWPEFAAGYRSSQVEAQYIEMIRTAYQGEEFLIFLGVWCSDTRRDLPRFLRIADDAGIPRDRITLYSLDRTKKSADGMTDRHRIERVPTFIVLKDGSEVGRITEYPQVSVEADLLTILAAARAK